MIKPSLTLFASALLGTLLLGACAGKEPRSDEVADYRHTTVFFGTNRNRGEDDRLRKYYGEHRGELEFGSAVYRTEPDRDKSRLASIQPLPRPDFLSAIDHALTTARKPELLVFIHGYLRSFSQSGRVVADFARDTDFPGVAVVWSWPSTSNPARYTVDETNIRWAQRDFAGMLRDLFDNTGAQRIHLVGHSLGARNLVDTLLYDLLRNGIDTGRTGEVVLLAPDIDREIFRRDLAPRLVAAGLKVSLYTSTNDKALTTAERVHGHRRAGDSRGGPLVLAGIETIDVTAANRSILGHSYFEESDLVTRDLAQLLSQGLRAAERERLEDALRNDLPYWRLTITD